MIGSIQTKQYVMKNVLKNIRALLMMEEVAFIFFPRMRNLVIPRKENLLKSEKNSERKARRV